MILLQQHTDTGDVLPQ